jgi:hypothetical protein
VFIVWPHERHGSGGAPEGKGVMFWMVANVPSRNERFLSLAPTDAQRNDTAFRRIDLQNLLLRFLKNKEY